MDPPAAWSENAPGLEEEKNTESCRVRRVTQGDLQKFVDIFWLTGSVKQETNVTTRGAGKLEDGTIIYKSSGQEAPEPDGGRLLLSDCSRLVVSEEDESRKNDRSPVHPSDPPLKRIPGSIWGTPRPEPVAFDDLPKLDFVVVDQKRIFKLFYAWPVRSETSSWLESEVRLGFCDEKLLDKMIFLERSKGFSTNFVSDEYSRLCKSEWPRIPKNCQHLAIRNQALIYATPDTVCCTHPQREIHSQKSTSAKRLWPPLLRRYGTSIYWTQANNTEIMRWRDSEDDDPLKATLVRDFKGQETTVRHIAAADLKDYKHLTVAVTCNAQWKILFFPDVNQKRFFDLACPLRRVEYVAVMEDVVYALGSETDSLFPDVFVYHVDGRWFWGAPRLQETLPTAFFPLNGQLWLVCNGVQTCEVYEPCLGRWGLMNTPQFNDFTGFAHYGLDSNSFPQVGDPVGVA